MKLKSRGLGRKELIMDFREYEIHREGDEVLVTGTIKKPVHWDFSIRMCPDDIPGMVKIGLSRHTIGMFFRWLNPFSKNERIGLDDAKSDAKPGSASAAKSDATEAETAPSRKERKAEKKAEKAAAKAAKAADISEKPDNSGAKDSDAEIAELGSDDSSTTASDEKPEKAKASAG